MIISAENVHVMFELRDAEDKAAGKLLRQVNSAMNTDV
jgi:hypothetical protein